jgi:hypothetical protein
MQVPTPRELSFDLRDNFSNLFVEKGETDKDIKEVNWLEIANDLLFETKENAEYERSQGAGGVIDKLPTVNVEQEKDKLIDQLAKEIDPEKKQFLQQKYKNLMRASLNKVARVVHHKDGWHVLSEKGKNLGGPYKTKGEAVKRLRQVEYFKNASKRPFSKKVAAETMVDPYQSLTTHITEMRSRMEQVQQRLESNPLPKQAGKDETDPSELSIEQVFEDVAMGLDLLESKLKDEPESEELHKSLEELENLLWETEQKAGIKPEISEEEKAEPEPEHKEIVKEVVKEVLKEIEDKKEPVEKEEEKEKEEIIEINAAAVPNPALGQPIVPAPAPVKNVQPTDDDNLEVPIVKPTSPPPPGTQWVFDTQFNKYVIMPLNSSQTI